MTQEREEFEFASFDVDTKLWDDRNAVQRVVNPSSDNGRSSWTDLSENEEK